MGITRLEIGITTDCSSKHMDRENGEASQQREKNEADTQKDPAMRDGAQLSWCACTEAFPKTLDFQG